MSKDPAVLFYTSDFISGTMTMTDEDVGKYIRLLCLQHQKGRLSEKDMMFICRTYVKDVYEKFKIDENGFYYNERMENETKKRKLYSESRRKNVSTRYKQKRKSKSTYVEHMENENENENINNKVKGIVKGEPKTEQAVFIESFSGLYERMTGHPFNADKKHYIIISNLIKKHGYDALVEKSKLLACYCQSAEIWFAKEGWSCFTPETLKTHWNRIVPILSEEQKKIKKSEELYQKLKDERRIADELVKDSIAA